MHSFFGIQLALDLPPGHAVRSGLAAAVTTLRDNPTPVAQRPCWGKVAGLLRPAVSTAVLGTWDLIRDRGDAEYEDWASGLEEMAEWPAEDFGTGDQLLLVSLIFLVAANSNADRTLGDLCDLPESAWHRRATYAKLLGAPPQLNFMGVLGSGLYLAPHPDQSGFSEQVLSGEGFEYLTRVV
jgi:hypothetical protein